LNPEYAIENLKGVLAIAGALARGLRVFLKWL
jgi:hypothetical protein